ncbi:DUF1566 domain-containing protein [Leptospira noguchii]|uniref:Lcl C-terminal domain-containing protein n=1 Tax=Leptospira noguchii TaxID=28182 RepID=UPI001FB6B90C|nr:DUF1566 domain-containing protein [Leptospira noguchii]UOG33928.1 DUF1566 domain-containing protein [Leptospira noguchii]UOG44784.1 DUF1566 domain-containing protein [Leptospira noguchii]
MKIRKLYVSTFCFLLILTVQIQADAPPTRFEDKLDGTVLDKRTGLIWQICAAGLGSHNGSGRSTCGMSSGNLSGNADQHHWGNALRYCNGDLSKKPPVLPAGKTWRLPNINELKSIVDRSQLNPAMDTSVLIAGGDYYWASTTANWNLANAWTVNFLYGSAYMTSTKDWGYYVRCVAGP